jgi:uncharacterized protein (TIGR03067 family)
MTSALLLMAASLAAPGPKDPPKKDPPALVGEWVVEGTVVAGQPKPLPAGAAWVFTADGKAEFRVGRGKPADRGTFTADPRKDPAEVDITLGAGAAVRAIYRAEGDKLTLCMAQTGADRPKGFDAPPGSTAVLWTLKRVPKKE